VAEWSKAHAWKVCIPLKGIEGSNPFLSAKENPQRKLRFFCFSTPQKLAFERFEKQKNKRAQLFLGFYACSRYLSGINEVTPFVFAIKKPQQLLWIFYFIK
jgi:hypothetical protein